jgi:rhamnosyl/mannosyltransferase
MLGKPLISSELGTGTSFVNIHNQTGIVIPPSSPTDLNKAMEFLWRSPECAKKMGVEAEKRFDTFFTADRMCNSYKDLYRRVLENKPLPNIARD